MISKYNNMNNMPHYNSYPYGNIPFMGNCQQDRTGYVYAMENMNNMKMPGMPPGINTYISNPNIAVPPSIPYENYNNSPYMSSLIRMPFIPDNSMPGMFDPGMPTNPFIPDSSMPGMFDPDMPAIPAMPNMPDMPDMPDMNDMPAMPNMPGMPDMNGIPSMPGMPDIPDMRDITNDGNTYPNFPMEMNCKQLLQLMRMMNCMENMNGEEVEEILD